MSDFDVAIIGAGIAGASLAAELAAGKRVLLLEAEDQPGYHATGRSAAFWSETYGGPAVQPLTSASGPFLAQPPAAFADGTFLNPRGALYLGHAGDREQAQSLLGLFAQSGVALETIPRDAAERHVTGLHAEWTVALWEPDCCDIDVARLHAAYLAFGRKSGAVLQCRAGLESARFVAGRWAISTRAGEFTASLLVNAAGAWADSVARSSGVNPIGIAPFRRTIAQLAIDPPASANLPLVIGLDGSFYFKPDAGGRLWLSPHDEIATPPCDAAPDELDVAMAIDRFHQVVDWKILRMERKWAGLRSFAPDRLPVIGFDPECPAFFWLAGQGGFGIQTAPAMAWVAASLIRETQNPVPDANLALYRPDRLR